MAITEDQDNELQGEVSLSPSIAPSVSGADAASPSGSESESGSQSGSQSAGAIGCGNPFGVYVFDRPGVLQHRRSSTGQC